MALLTSQWQPNNPAAALEALATGQRMGATDAAAQIQALQFVQKQVADAVTERRLQEQEQRLQAQSNANQALQLLQEQRLNRAMQLQEDYRKTREKRMTAEAAARKARYDADNAPYRDPFATGGAPSIPSAPGTAEGIDLFNAGNPASPAEGLLQLNATGYHPGDVKNAAEAKMEGGMLDAKGKPIRTLESFKRGESDYVTVAVPQGSPLFGKTLTSPDAPGVVFKADDHFGTLDGKLVQGPKIDVATESRDMASKLTGPMRFSIADNLPAAAATKPIPVEPSIPATDAPPIAQGPADAPANPAEQIIRNMSAMLDGRVPTKIGQQALVDTVKQLATQQARGTGVTRPNVRNFNDGTTRQWNPDKQDWDILATKDTSAADQRQENTEERMVLSRLNHERSMLSQASTKLSKIKKSSEIPKWPWEEGGKYYKKGGVFGKTEINKSEYDELMRKGEATEWSKLNGEVANRQARIAELEGQLSGGQPAGAQPAQPKVYQDEEDARKDGAKTGDIILVMRDGKPARARLN